MHIHKTFAIFACVCAYLILPFLLPFPAVLPKGMCLAVFFTASALTVIGFARVNQRRIHTVHRESDSFQEQLNLTQDRIRHAALSQRSLKEKITRYLSLKTIIEQINASLTLEEVAQKLCDICFSSIARSRGVCAVYLVDEPTHTLKLFKARKQDNALVIRAKQGDIFDSWVHRHARPLMVEDTAKDFRFDQDRILSDDSRAVKSLIAVPLVAGADLLGVLRLDHPEAGFFSQEDCRFLVTLGDLGAVALENARLYEHTQDLAIHDGLTGLFTKTHFFQLLENECANGLRHGRLFCLMMVDIDFFKRYNDSFGHAAGDIVLKALSDTLARFCADNSATACRFGGEEFCLIVPLTDKKAGLALADGLRRDVEHTAVSLRRQETTVTVSIGLSAFPADGADAQELIKKADRAMYEAKRAGRNRATAA